MKNSMRWFAASATVLLLAASWIAWRFESDIEAASAKAALGSVLITTRCGPSALQMAIRHPNRITALVLLVPLAYKPEALADSTKPLAPWAESLLRRRS